MISDANVPFSFPITTLLHPQHLSVAMLKTFMSGDLSALPKSAKKSPSE